MTSAPGDVDSTARPFRPPPGSWVLLAAVAVAALVIVVVVVAMAGRADDDARDRLPAIELPALSGGGGSLDIGSLEGPAVVHLWATWCAPCRLELPGFQGASEHHDGVRFIGIDIGEAPADARAFLDDVGVAFEQFADPHGELTDELGVSALPVTIVIDGTGDIALQHLGRMGRDELDDALADLGTE